MSIRPTAGSEVPVQAGNPCTSFLPLSGEWLRLWYLNLNIHCWLLHPYLLTCGILRSDISLRLLSILLLLLLLWQRRTRLLCLLRSLRLLLVLQVSKTLRYNSTTNSKIRLRLTIRYSTKYINRLIK